MFKTNIVCGWGLISLAQIALRMVLLVEPKPIKLAHDSADSCDAGQKTERWSESGRGEREATVFFLPGVSLQLIGWTRCSLECQVILSCVHNKAGLKPQFIPNLMQTIS